MLFGHDLKQIAQSSKNSYQRPISNYTPKNPITQEFGSSAGQWKPSCRVSAINNQETFHKASKDEIFQHKGRGAFNEHDQILKKSSEWRTGIKPINEYWENKGKTSDLDNPRGLKIVSSASRLSRNPIIEGDKAGYNLPNPRKVEKEPSDELKRMASVGRFNPGDSRKEIRKERLEYEQNMRTRSEQGEAFWSYGGRSKIETPLKKGDEVRNAIQYSFAGKYVDRKGVAGKISQTNPDDFLFASLERNKEQFKGKRGKLRKRERL